MKGSPETTPCGRTTGRFLAGTGAVGSSPRSRTHRLTLLVLLVACLLGSQWALAHHGIDHAFHEHEGACVACLALPGMHAVPARPPTLPVSRAEAQIPAPAIPPAPVLSSPLPFHSRAPPSRQSC